MRFVARPTANVCCSTLTDCSCKTARLYGRFVRGARLPYRFLSIGNLQAHLILQLLAPHLSLPDLEFVAHGVGLCDTIPQGQRQLQPDSIGWEIAPKNLPQRGPVAAGSYASRGCAGQRIQIACQAAVLHGSHQIQSRFERIERALQTDLRILDLKARARQIRTISERLGDQVRQRLSRFRLGNSQRVGGNNVGREHLRVGESPAGDRRLHDQFLLPHQTLRD